MVSGEQSTDLFCFTDQSETKSEKKLCHERLSNARKLPVTDGVRETLSPGGTGGPELEANLGSRSWTPEGAGLRQGALGRVGGSGSRGGWAAAGGGWTEPGTEVPRAKLPRESQGDGGYFP